MANSGGNNKKRDPPGFVVNDIVDYPKYYGLNTTNRSPKSKSYHHPRRDHLYEDDGDDYDDAWLNGSSFHSCSYSNSGSSDIPMVVFVEKDNHNDSMILDSSVHSSPSSYGRHNYNRRTMSSKSLTRSSSRRKMTTTRDHHDNEELDAVFEIDDRRRPLHRSQSRSRR